MTMPATNERQHSATQVGDQASRKTYLVEVLGREQELVHCDLLPVPQLGLDQATAEHFRCVKLVCEAVPTPHNHTLI